MGAYSLNYYQHHIGDFDRATRHLTRIERSVYRDLLDVYYDTEKPLTADTTALCRKIIARSNEEATAVEQVLNEFFIKTPAGWYNDICEEQIDVYRASNSQKSVAGKASAAKRALKIQQAINGNPTSVGQPLNERATDGQLTNNHKPVTNNHKPLTIPPTKPSGSKEREASIVPERGVDPIALSLAMEQNGVQVNSADSRLIELTRQGLSIDTAIAACLEARKSKPNGAIPLAYVVKIINRWGVEATTLGVKPRAAAGRQSRHSGFEKIDYSEGIGENGRIL